MRIFGYLKPYNDELKGKHVSEYKLQYCTLCHGLRTHFGFFSTLLLNYECTFLYVFLNAISKDMVREQQSFRCPVNPLRKSTSKVESSTLEYASFVNYHLAVLKAFDGCTDTRGFKRLAYKVMHWLLAKGKRYRQLRVKYSTMAENTEQLCKELYDLERSNDVDFDRCSATMGSVLKEIVTGFLQEHPTESQQPILAFANHLGMWTYLIDAYDDYEKDLAKDSFNPLTLFSNLENREEADRMCLRSGEVMLGMMTANLSELLKAIEIYKHNEVLENIVWFGTRNAVHMCKKKKVKKKDDCNCKK